MKKRFTQLFWVWMLIELLSLFVYPIPWLRSLCALVLAFGVAVFAYRQPALGLSALVIELLVGSKGSLFKLGLSSDPDAGVPIRMLFFVAFLLGWIGNSLLEKRYKKWVTFLSTHWYYGLIALLLVHGFMLGWYIKQPFLFSDANAWGFLLLLLPVLDLASSKRDELTRWIPIAAFVGLAVMTVKTIVLFYFFSHAFPEGIVDYVYWWIRRTGVGEVTRILPAQPAFRVFFQSHIFSLLALFGLLPWFFHMKEKDSKRFFLAATLLFSVILISFSRSFWLGLGIGGLVLIVWLLVAIIKKRLQIRQVLVSSGFIVGSAIMSVFLVAFLLFFPFPWGDRGRLDQLLFARADLSEDAAQSRWQLLPKLWEKIQERPWRGHGFGATVMYTTKDPRIVQKTGGSFTTYIFEWGWLDSWIKFGVLGIPVLLGWLLWLGWRASRIFGDQSQIQWGIYLSLLVFVVVHAFTPYLNHPLGIGFLLFIEGFLTLHEFERRQLIATAKTV